MDHIYGCFYCGEGGALGISSLQQEQTGVLNGELHVLYVGVMLLQVASQLHEFCIALREDALKANDRFRSTNTGNHVFTLGVGQEFTVDLGLAGGRVASKQNSSAAIWAQIAKDHGHDGHSGAYIVVDLVVVTVEDSSGSVPTAEHGLYGGHQLFPGVCGRF